MNKLEENAKKFVEDMKKKGYEVSVDFAINLLTIKEKNPNISKDELVEQAFKKTLAFYDDFNKNPKPYVNSIDIALQNELDLSNKQKNTKPFQIKEKSNLNSKERDR